MKDHPNAYTVEEQEFLARIGRMRPPTTVELSGEDFDRLSDLLGRYPTYEVTEDGKFDYSKPTVINCRFIETKVAESGLENLYYRGQLFTRKP